MNKITVDMLVCDVLDKYPELEDVMISYGLNCVGCPGATNESLEDAAEGHGVDIDELIKAINENL